MDLQELPEIRCPNCGRLLARGEARIMQFKCTRCKSYVLLRAERPDSVLHDSPRSSFHAYSQEKVCH